MRHNHSRFLLFCFILLLIIGAAYSLSQISKHPPQFPQVSASPSPTGRELNSITKTSDCHAHDSLPDSACTPGSIDPRVTQENIQSTICVSGYTKTVRPPTSYTKPLEEAGIRSYGLPGTPSDYEFDHLIPLELGGNPTAIANLWPEPADSALGFRQKDTVENYLHDAVCDGKMTLLDAQLQIATDWTAVYREMQR